MANFFYLILFCFFIQSCSTLSGSGYVDNFQDKQKTITMNLTESDYKKISLDTFYMRTTESVYDYFSLTDSKQKKELLQKIISNYLNIYIETKDDHILSRYFIAIDRFISENESLEKEPLSVHPILFFKDDQ